MQEKLEKVYRNVEATKAADTEHQNAEINQGLKNKLEKSYKAESAQSAFESLAENVSEDCYNHIFELVMEYIDEEHLVDAVERGFRKHGPGLLDSAAKGVGNTVRTAGQLATHAIANSQSGLARGLKRIPFVHNAVKRQGTQLAAVARKQNENAFKAKTANIKKEFDAGMQRNSYISDPNEKAAHLKQIQDLAYKRQTAADAQYKDNNANIRTQARNYGN